MPTQRRSTGWSKPQIAWGVATALKSCGRKFWKRADCNVSPGQLTESSGWLMRLPPLLVLNEQRGMVHICVADTSKSARGHTKWRLERLSGRILYCSPLLKRVAYAKPNRLTSNEDTITSSRGYRTTESGSTYDTQSSFCSKIEKA